MQAIALASCALLVLALPRADGPFIPLAESFRAHHALAPCEGEWSASRTAEAMEGGLLCVVALADGPQGWLGIDRRLRRVVSFRVPAATGALPTDSLPPAAVAGVALGFAREQAPEVFAGGEPLLTVAEAISELGDRRFTWQRVDHGVRLPARVEVGVRGFDGKVAWYRLELPDHDPAAAPVLDLAAAQRAARAASQPAEPAVARWLEGYRELRQVDRRWQTVWVLAAELPPTDPRLADRIGELRRWVVDAVDGRVVATEAIPLGSDGRTYAWYRRQGGEHVAPPSLMRPPLTVWDGDPRLSPDGRQVLFRSNRERPGYPSWLRVEPGVCTINLDGTGLRCVLPEPTLDARWSLDGRSLVAAQGQAGVVLLDLATGQQQRLPAPDGWPYEQAARLADGRVVALAARHQLHYRLDFLDPANPTAPPLSLKPWGEQRTLLGDVQPEADGGLLLTVGVERRAGVRDKARQQAPWALYRLQPAAPDSPPETVAEYLVAGERLGPGPDGQLLTGFWSTQWYLLDPATGQDRPWSRERLLMPTNGQPFRRDHLALHDLGWSPDGARLLCSADYWSGQPGDPAGQVLWLANGDGGEAKPLTLPVAANGGG